MKIYEIEDLNIMISLFCPGKCVNCNIWTYPKEIITKNEIDTALINKALKSKSLKNTFYFDLTGGESQLSPKYLEVIKSIANNIKNPFVHTNISGWYPETHYRKTKEAIKFIPPERFRIDISLDGRPENYAKIRLVPNGWEKAIKTAKLLKKLGIIIRFTMIIYKENINDIEWLVDFANNLGVGYYFGYPRGSNNYLNSSPKKDYFSNKEIEIIEKKLLKVGWLNERRISNWLWAKSIYLDEVPYFDCYMGRKSLVIDPYGNVYPCNEMVDFLNMGNLKDFNGNLDELLSSPKAIEVLEKIEKKECQPCTMLCAHKIKFPWGYQTGMISKG